jgi:hypothetical protein
MQNCLGMPLVHVEAVSLQYQERILHRENL